MTSKKAQDTPITFNDDGSIDVDLGEHGKHHIQRATVKRWREIGVLKDRADEWLKQMDADARAKTGYPEDDDIKMASQDTTAPEALALLKRAAEYRSEFERRLFTDENPYPAIMAELTGVPADELPSWTIMPDVYTAIINHWLTVPLNPSSPARRT